MVPGVLGSVVYEAGEAGAGARAEQALPPQTPELGVEADAALSGDLEIPHRFGGAVSAGPQLVGGLPPLVELVSQGSRAQVHSLCERWRADSPWGRRAPRHVAHGVRIVPKVRMFAGRLN